MAHESDVNKVPFWVRRVPNYFLVRLARLGWGFTVVGLEHLPREGPLIVAGNHVALLDGPLLAMAVSSVRHMHFLGKAELFRIPILSWYLRRAGAIPLDRSRGDIAAMRAALDLLGRGGCLGLFPEGTRSKTGLPGNPKGGIGFLAGQSGAAVVPARLLGTNRFPKPCHLEVRLGSPLTFFGQAQERGDCLSFAGKVMEAVFSL
jgi:1-acyl-sn-glycerol-3-phosphate acyltransferase